VPERKDERLRQMLSGVYALAMVFGSLLLLARLKSYTAASVLTVPKVLRPLDFGMSRFRGEWWGERHLGVMSRLILIKRRGMFRRREKRCDLYKVHLPFCR
jgi:hypothetical protein